MLLLLGLLTLAFLALLFYSFSIISFIYSNYYYLFSISCLIRCLCFLRYWRSLSLKAVSYYLSYFATSCTIWAMIMMLLIWSSQSYSQVWGSLWKFSGLDIKSRLGPKIKCISLSSSWMILRIGSKQTTMIWGKNIVKYLKCAKITYFYVQLANDSCF